jgi:hypothetical protein
VHCEKNKRLKVVKIIYDTVKKSVIEFNILQLSIKQWLNLWFQKALNRLACIGNDGRHSCFYLGLKSKLIHSDCCYYIANCYLWFKSCRPAKTQILSYGLFSLVTWTSTLTHYILSLFVFGWINSPIIIIIAFLFLFLWQKNEELASRRISWI